ncbi:MAG: ACT domain-containing protein, partial [Pseudohongiellaceae bacterium]
EEIVGKPDWIRQNQKKALELLAQKGFGPEQVKAVWNDPDEDYFLRMTPEDIAWHTQSIAEHGGNPEPLIKIKDKSEHRHEGATQVFIYSKNSNYLFANIANAFDRLNLNIQGASIFNSEHEYCIKVFMVLEENGSPIGKNPRRIHEITRTLQEYVSASGFKPCNASGRTPRKLRHFTHNTRTSLTNDDNLPYSTLEVLCPDRPGLLAQVANIFVEMNINLHNAKITTLGENVEDVFFITDSNNQPLLDEDFNEKLQHSIRTTLDAQVQH